MRRVLAALTVTVALALTAVVMIDEWGWRDQMRADIQRVYADIADAEARHAACVQAAEVGERLNDAWHRWKDDRTAGPAQRVNELQDEHDRLADECLEGVTVDG